MAHKTVATGILGDWCSRDQAARILQVTSSRISQLMDQGVLASVLVGRRRFPNLQSVYGLKSLRETRQLEIPGTGVE